MNDNINKEIKNGMLLVLFAFLGIFAIFASLFIFPTIWMWILLCFWPVITSVYGILLIMFIIWCVYVVMIE